MKQPKSNSKQDHIKFLIKCLKSNQVQLWNNWRKSKPDFGIDLKNFNIKDFDITGLDLKGIDLSGADLRWSKLIGVDLRDSNLEGVNLRGAHIIGSDLRGANLKNAYLRGLNLIGTDLRKAVYNINELLKTTFKHALIDSDIQPLISLNLSDEKIKYNTELEEVKHQIKELQKKANKTSEENNLNKDKVNRLEKREKELINKLDTINLETIKIEKEKETKNITKIIGYLGNMPEEISKEQIHLEKSRSVFNSLAMIVFAGGLIIIILLISNILTSNKYHLPAITNAGIYLAYALTTVLPMVVLFLFLRQANIKTKEIDRLNEKSIIRQQVKEALKSYDLILSGDQLKEKTISSIDRILYKLFENNLIEGRNIKNEKSNASMSDLQKLARMIDDIRMTSTNYN